MLFTRLHHLLFTILGNDQQVTLFHTRYKYQHIASPGCVTQIYFTTLAAPSPLAAKSVSISSTETIVLIVANLNTCAMKFSIVNQTIFDSRLDPE